MAPTLPRPILVTGSFRSGSTWVGRMIASHPRIAYVSEPLNERRPPLPVLRVKFGDPDATWFYVDPHMGQVVTRFTRRERLQRWIYHGLHSLDFNFWYYNGAVWRATMVALNAGGALLSGIGLVLAVKRVKRGISHKKAQKPQKVFL